MKIFAKGLVTGLTLQLAVGPVFFFIINLTLQRTVIDGLIGAAAVAFADYIYIALGILGIGRLLEIKKFKKIFGIMSSVVLAGFGIFIIKGTMENISLVTSTIGDTNLISSFTSVFLLTISNPLTIVLFTSIFAAKALENDYTRKELFVFGSGTGLATFIFMGLSVILISVFKAAIPIMLIQALNITVGCLLIVYAGYRFWKIFRYSF